MICENCNNEHDGSFASGRFCCKECSRSFSTKLKRTEINKKVGASLKGRKTLPIKYCPICSNEITNFKKTCSKTCGEISKQISLKLYYNDHPNQISDKAKLSYKNGRVFKGGSSVPWYKYNDIKVQGTYELRTCKILDSLVKSNKIKSWEYTNDRIPYIGLDNKEHTYLLDFKVFRNDDSFYYIETKGRSNETDLLKWKAVKDLGFELEVWFKTDISKHEKYIGEA